MVKFAVVLSPARYFGVLIAGMTPSYSSPAQPLSTWINLFVNFQIRADLKEVRTFMTFGPSYSNQRFTLPSSGYLSFASTDKVLIGGPSTFIGEISSVRIFSPGTAAIQSKIYLNLLFINLSLSFLQRKWRSSHWCFLSRSCFVMCCWLYID